MDQDQQWLINCLNASLDPNHQVRAFAETSLQQASLQPGFGVALASIGANRELQHGLRQLAVVLLKQFIKKHWNEDEEAFEHPVASSDEKASIRRLLLSSLDDPYRKICTAVSVAVASIAQYDWPDDWPELMPSLLSLISDQTKKNAVHGALRCLALLSSDMDDKQVPKIVPVLFPCLIAIVSSPQVIEATALRGLFYVIHQARTDIKVDASCSFQLGYAGATLFSVHCSCYWLTAKTYFKSQIFQNGLSGVKCMVQQIHALNYDKYLLSKAISIVYNCTSMLGVMSGVYKTETSAMMLPMLQPWMEQFSSILNHQVPSEDPDDWSMRMEVLKCLNQFIQNFPGLAETQFIVIVGPLWQTFVSSLEVYERSSIEGAEDPYDGRYDSDGAEKSLESFVIQLFEFLLTVVGSPKFVKVVANNVKELVYYTIGFLQMTEQQLHTWSLDANQYVADEDDNTYSCRVSGALLLEEVISSCGSEGIEAVIDSAKRRISESQQGKDSGSPGWWRLREASLFALASVSEQLLQVEVSAIGIGKFLEQILTEDMATGVHEYPFLYARLFSCVAKFSSVIDHRVTEQFLYAAIKSLGMDVPPPVKVGACRALSQLLPDADRGILHSHAMDLFSSLTELLNNASEETMHLVLETLQAAVKGGHEFAASIEPIISPIILNTWASHVSDPFISIDALEVLEAIKNAPGCIHALASRILPYIGPVLSNPFQQPDGLVSGSLDLVTMLLKNAPIDVIKAAYEVSFDPIIRIILQSDDHSEMQNATQCLAAFVSGGKQDLLTWCGDPGFTMRSLLDVASRLLDPNLESSGSLFVGSYILQLILHLPSQMAQHIRDLVSALIRRMQSCQISGLKSSLLLIFARLVHLSVPHVEQFINLLVSIPAEGHLNSFAYLMFEWTRLQGEIQGAYQIKVTTTALALLLSSRHVELGNVNVQGHLIKTVSGITTRSKAKKAPDQWTMVPLPTKIMAILADTLIEIQEQVLAGEEEDSDWEEVGTDDAGTDQELLYSTNAALHGRPTYEYLDAMAKAFNEGEDEDYEDELFSSADPLNEINLVNYLVDFFAKLCQSDRPYFEHLFQSLTKAQQNAIQIVLKR